MRTRHLRTGASLKTLRAVTHSSRWAFGLALLLVLAVARGQDATPAAAATRHAQAIATARAGRYAEAIEALDELRRAEPADRALLADSILVHGWAERDRDVLDLAALLTDGDATLDLARTIAKSARNVRRYDLAASWYERALALTPTATDARIGLALTHADAGNGTAAQAAIDALAPAEQDTLPVRIAQAYVHERTGAPLAALRDYEAILAEDAGNPAALRGKALALRALLLPDQALVFAAAHPRILNDVEIARLTVDRLAVELRLAARTPYLGPDRAAQAATTLARLDAALALVDDPAASLALRLDRVVVLADAGRSADAVAAFEALPATSTPPAPYVLIAVSDAYRREHRPRDSLCVLQTAAGANAESLELQFALIYTYLDLDDFTAAFALADQLSGRLPLANSVAGSTVVKGNQDRLRAELTAGIAYAYGDQLARAEKRFEDLLRQAPGNLDLRHELANVYRWRGWLDRSLFEYRQVLTVEPELLAARIGYAYAQIDAREYPEVATTVRELAAERDREPAVARLTEEWALHNRSELDVVASDADSTGPTYGNDSYRVDATWYTRPLAYRWRGVVHVHESQAAFPEGDAERRRLGGGVEYRAERLTATGELSGARGGGETGLRGDFAWRPSDRWTVAALLDLNSNDMPLRGWRTGVEADLVGLTATLARNESVSVTTGARTQRYTDGNSSESLFLDGRYRFVNEPRLKLELTGELGASRADRDDVVYFSPRRDTTVLVGLHQEWRLFRRYERSLTQHADLAVGRYDQAAYPAGSLWRARYSVQWQLSQRVAVSAGLERSRQFFDGAVEHSTQLSATLRARL